MIKIERQARGFLMRFSEPGTGWRGFSVKAATSEEVKTAIDHYHGGGPSQVTHANAAVEDCPICRWQQNHKDKPALGRRGGDEGRRRGDRSQPVGGLDMTIRLAVNCADCDGGEGMPSDVALESYRAAIERAIIAEYPFARVSVSLFNGASGEADRVAIEGNADAVEDEARRRLSEIPNEVWNSGEWDNGE